MAGSKTALITGAGSGIGRATALLLAEQGWNIALAGRTVAKLEDVAGEIAEQSGDVETACYEVDLTQAPSLQSLPKVVAEHFGSLDALVSVAGNAPLMPIREMKATDWRACVDTNLSAVVLLTTAAWNVLATDGGGIVVNVSSMSAFDPFPGFAAYAAVKAGVNMFTKVTGDEGAEADIRAVAIAPGAVETPMLRSLFDEQTVGKDKTLDPKEVGRIIVDCVTGQRDFESGETIQVPSPS